jgi:hypothetical protein
MPLGGRDVKENEQGMLGSGKMQVGSMWVVSSS